MSNTDDVFEAYYDEEMDLWNVRRKSNGMCYPMTGENMANEITTLLNRYEVRLHDVLDELWKKDRKFEDLGYDLDELDRELDARGY